MRVKIDPNKNFYGEVFGADCFVENFSDIVSTGIEVKLFEDGLYYVMINDKMAHDTAFFSTEEMEHLIIIEE